jgi:tetratricopeptide (TPR) repeat protein
MLKRILIGLLAAGGPAYFLLKDGRLFRPGYESHITGDGAAGVGFQLAQEGKCGNAIPAFEHALTKPRLSVSDAAIFEGLGNCYIVTLEDKKGEPTEARGWHFLGLAHQSRGELDKAEVAHRKALELDPALTRARESLGAVHLIAGRAEAAIDELELALASNPAIPLVTRSNLALAYAMEGRSVAANAQVAELQRIGYPKVDRLREVVAAELAKTR